MFRPLVSGTAPALLALVDGPPVEDDEPGPRRAPGARRLGKPLSTSPNARDRPHSDCRHVRDRSIIMPFSEGNFLLALHIPNELD